MRVGIYGLLALALNAALFQFMAVLIGRHQMRFKPVVHAHSLDFIRMPEVPPPPPSRRSRTPPEPPPSPPPPSSPTQQVAEVRANVHKLPLPVPGLKIDVPMAPSVNVQVPGLPSVLVVGDPSKGGPGPVRMPSAGPAFIWASELAPVVRTPPLYPTAAKRRGIEGYVVLEFTVTETGQIKDPKIVESYPSDVFDRAALRAVRNWRFRPKEEGGKPVAVQARQRLEFKLRRR
ncbi:MAG: hypothetical protein Kow0060_22130 [Methylohalobius crimeensis]